MNVECKGCVGKPDRPTKDGTCILQLNPHMRMTLPQGCPYLMGRMKWRVV